MVWEIIPFLLLVSQLYWAWRGWKFLRRRVAGAARRAAISACVLMVYFVWLAFTAGWIGPRGTPVHLTAAEALISAPFLWWIASSFFAALVAGIIAIPRAITRIFRGPAQGAPASPGRRRFIERTATAAVAAPFVAGAYGLLYDRLNLETTRQKIVLPRLPKAFHGFRIAQLSDIHIGPFMPQEQIRKYVAIANALKPHLTVVTGDFVTWDPATQHAVVDALAGLRAPFGVFGCLGNHDAWAGVQDSITEMLGRAGIHMLRQARVPLTINADAINLMGVDFQTLHRFGRSVGVPQFLMGVEDLIERGQVNILLSHNPDTFDRAAELGIDLSLAGHTHGGQASLEFISPELAPSRLVTPYVAGLFQKPGGMLYVNRGIGTIGIPIRLGAPPEITVFELVCG